LWFHFKYTILELSTAVKPYAFEHLFAAYDFDRVVYLDPDVRLYASLDAVTEALDSASIVLTPHLTCPSEDGKRPGELDILRSGAFNLGFIALARSSDAQSFLVWWQQKLYDHCVVDMPRGLFVDQKWIDLVPGMFAGVHVLRDPGYNVAYWNLAHRAISRGERGYEAAGARLAFFHFSGLDVEREDGLSIYQNRLEMRDLPEATHQLLRAYREELLSAEYLTCRRWPYVFGKFRNGVPIPDAGRPIHHEAPELAATIEDPFSEDGYAAFLRVWNEAIQAGDAAHQGVSRLAYRIYRTRTDLQASMPDLFGGNYVRFLKWMLVRGRVEHDLGDVFLSTISEALRVHQEHRAGAQEGADAHRDSEGALEVGGGGPRIALTRLAAKIHGSRSELQRSFPDPYGRDGARYLVWLLTYGKAEHGLSEEHLAPMRALWQSVVRAQPDAGTRLKYRLLLGGMSTAVRMRQTAVRVRSGLTAFAKPAPFSVRREGRETGPLDDSGVNLVGYFHAKTGIGQTVRGAREALAATGIPMSLRCADDTGIDCLHESPVGPMSREFPYRTNLIYVNADQAILVRRRLGDAFYRNRRNVGFWTWELDEFPEEWQSAFAPYQEIWTSSTFCQKAICRLATVPVHCVPYAVAPVVPEGMGRSHFGLPEEKFLFLFAFDVLSVPERKNPLAAVRAFEKAFGGDARFQLVLKVNHADRAPAFIAELKRACAPGAVRILDASLSREEMYGLIGCSDCIVSLHRSEGFGLLMAEGMYLGKPAIATKYSGNLDFMTADNSLLVDYKLIPVGLGCAPYDPVSVWADADVDQAAAYMKQVAESADLRSRLSIAGAEFVKANLSPEAVGRTIRMRLEELRNGRG
ncbi:MAG: glycosyltransferase, partial [Bryobacteraceae bacterium]